MLYNFALKVGWSLRFFPATLYLYLIRLSEASHVCYPNVNQDSGAITREKTFVFNLNWRGMEAAKRNHSRAKKAFNRQRKSLEEAVDYGVFV